MRGGRQVEAPGFFWRNASVSVEHECEELRHANCLSVRGGGVAAAEGGERRRRVEPRPLEQTQHSNTTVTSLTGNTHLGADWFVCVCVCGFLFFSGLITLVAFCCAAHQLSDDIILSV